MASSAGPSVLPRDLARFSVQSSDVISDMRVNVSEEGTEKVIWYKERFLADEEIIENLVENATSTVQWTIHRPSRGWYIRLRSPSFPPGMFISLAPPPRSSAYYTEAALTFACRTLSNSPSGRPHLSIRNSQSSIASSSNISLDSDVTLTDGQQSPIIHSYPPTPTQTSPPLPSSRPLSPLGVEGRSSGQLSRELPPSHRNSRQSLIVSGGITHFLLTPHSQPHIPQDAPQATSLFTRVVSALKNHTPSHSSSFTISPIPAPSSASSPASSPPMLTPHTLTPTPILTFHDRTPVWTVRSTTGILELDNEYVKILGVDMSFYVAVALTYLEFLNEREGYLAAVTD